LVEIYYSKGLFELLKCGKFTHYYQIQVHDFTNFTIVLSRPTNKKPPASLCTCRETLPENRVNESVTHDFTNLLLSFYYGAVTKTQKPASLCTCRETQRENRVQWNQVICHSGIISSEVSEACILLIWTALWRTKARPLRTRR